MYVPPYNRVDDEAHLRAMVQTIAAAQFVSIGQDGFPTATMLPILWEGSGRGGTVIAHMARANPQWRSLAQDDPVLLICSGPDAYISPNWYAAKYEHGRVVPTWNYSAVHLFGTVRVREDPVWLRTAVDRLTDTHESGRPQPWQVTDAPEQYIRGQLAGIVGIEVAVQRVEGKAKLSQNRSDADRHGVVDGLRLEQSAAARAVADAMAADL